MWKFASGARNANAMYSRRYVFWALSVRHRPQKAVVSGAIHLGHVQVQRKHFLHGSADATLRWQCE